MRLSRLPFRIRLTLWYAALFSLSLGTYELLSYYQLRSAFFSQMDAALAAELGRIAPSIGRDGSFPEASRPDRGLASPPAPVTDFMVRTIDGEGRVLGSRNGFPPMAEAAAPGIRSFRLGDTRYRVFTEELPGNGGTEKRYVQIAGAFNEVEHELQEYFRRFLIWLPITLAFAAAGGLFLARAAMKPVVAITELALEVGEGRLSDRLQHRGSEDEIGRLAKAFDVMLDRLESAFIREKRFSADASHELRTPLAALKGKLEVALSRPRSAPEYESVLAGMRSDVDRLISLSSDLLLFSRVGIASAAARSERVDLNELLDSCLDQIAIAHDEARIAVSRDYRAGLMVDGVRDYLIRLFLNLLDNAVKYSGPDVSLRLSTRAERGMALVLVEDSGPGIPTAELPRFFEPFHRAEMERSRNTGGAGLGLAIAREIVRAQGGGIDIESRIGSGTSVSVRLRLAAASART